VYAVEWVNLYLFYILNKSHPDMFRIPCISEGKNVIESNDLYRKGHAFPGHSLYMGPIFSKYGV
jgi:hypothetical protein